MSILAFLLAAATVNALPSMVAMESHQRDTRCSVALKAEATLGAMHEQATTYFDERVKTISDAELRELLMISAEESILPNINRREIASNCVLLYQVMKLREARGDKLE